MRKVIVTLIGMIGIAGSGLVIGWPYIRMEFADSAYYTRQNHREYEYYTPELLKKMPEVSENYKFEFGRITGTEANVFTVKFYGVSDTRSIRDYLKSEGYEPQASCDVEAQCWKSRATHDEVTVGNLHSQTGVFVQVYRRLYSGQ